MKAGIVGSGALGSLFSHIFQRAGIPFSVYEKDKSVADEIHLKGLTLSEGEISETIHPAISSSPGVLSDADIILLFVKSYSTEDAIQCIKSSIKKDSVIVSLQNGLGNFEKITRHIDENRIVLGTTTYGATKTSPSSVLLGGKGSITIGSGSASSVEAADNLLSKSGLQFNRIFNPHIAVWKKAVINAGINPIASVLNVNNGTLLENPYSMNLQKLAVIEAVNTAEAAGIHFDHDAMLQEVRDVCSRTSGNVCSMLQDLRNRRRTEIDSINGEIINTASRYGIPVPVTESLFLLVKALES